MNRPSKEEEAIWEAILLGWDLSMARGIGQMHYQRQLFGKPTNWDPSEDKRVTQEQHIERLNKEQWADPVFCARRSVQVSKEQTERWAYLEYRTKMKLAQANGKAKRQPRMADCCPDKAHEAKGMCSKHYRQYL